MREINEDNRFTGSDWYRKYGRFIYIFLLVMAVTAGILLSVRHPPDSREIILVQPDKLQNQSIEISISGQVAYPGIYLVNEDDTIRDIIARAGGNVNEDYSNIQIDLVPSYASTFAESQKININTAAEWLLDALPGIGAEKARAIIDYREQNGPFKYVEELKNVPGIGDSIFNDIKDLIKVID